MRSFGVGCLHFSLGTIEKNTLTINEYKNEIFNILKQLTTVTDINIFIDESSKNDEIDITSPSPILQNGEGLHPYIDFFEMEYKVYISYRIQAELLDTEEDYLDTFTENFKITMKHDWYGPVTYIECLDSKTDTSSSRAVQVIRKFISKEVKKIDTFLKADFIGPTPFHADFKLTPSDLSKEERDSFRLKQLPQRGYDVFSFEYDENRFKSEEIALEKLMEFLDPEIGFFYDIVTKRVAKMKKWQDIDKLLHEILELEENGKRLNSIFIRSKLFRSIFKKLGIFKAEEIFNQSENKKHYNRIYLHDKNPTYLKNLVDQEISEEISYPVIETIELLEYLDKKHSKSFELSIIFSAAILGGVIASLVTAAFK